MSSPRLFLTSPYVGVQLLNLDFGKAGAPGRFLADVSGTRFGIAINACSLEGENHRPFSLSLVRQHWREYMPKMQTFAMRPLPW
jgi:hypothetical protein